ncbi:MAG: SDR family oxidoreductase [Methylococcaceae bacterium]|nr:SDR family oxidoreductase [Methylococcaceae bacterium]
MVGCGDVGRRVARLEQEGGLAVTALARSEDSARQLQRLAIAPLRGDLDDPGSLSRLTVQGQILHYLAPPPGEGEGDPRIGCLLARLRAGNLPAVVVYISTSGVYGDCGGAWIDEDQPLDPQTDRARRRVAAERALQAWSADTGVPVVVLRVPGIYGPGRLPIDRVSAGRPLLREDQSPYSNRIHADDLAAACFLAARRGRAGAAYNVSDGNPTTMTDYFNRVADHAGLPRPPQIGLDEARRVLPPAFLSFLEESKRLDNRRMLADLRLTLRYPDLDLGLPACLAG